ncbi:YicC/YloC family endoribonuclease [Neorhodopirellula pilleata]|uniref:YicC family protein n=1 Tax=Neorhodopirellula pilleata TaxID=2714738 RepID=A0A5C6AB33_9BACT|nr:YicC/YloC family endoribonuclease [Neorhodopirellula pilleata]TWT96508.1 Conserved hypothetical protein CHP00255 [Neorhodopirellula pilleata]
MPSNYPHLRSMTGQGRCEVRGQAGVLVVEMRSVNNRGLKVVLRTNDALSAHESEINKQVAGVVQRGTVTVHASLRPAPGEDLPRINHAAALSYVMQLGKVAQDYANSEGNGGTVASTLELTNLLSVPGVLNSRETDAEGDEGQAETTARQQLLRDGMQTAIERFNEMRHHEAVEMAKALTSDLAIVAERSAAIETLAPSVIDRYRDRLLERVEKTLAEHRIEADRIDIIREVQLFADRSDISEEITRLASHVTLFTNVLEGNPSTVGANSGGSVKSGTDAVGRKLDFIIQEMFRETNTIGSKAGNAEIAQHVVEIKCAIERMRELVQNLE